MTTFKKITDRQAASNIIRQHVADLNDDQVVAMFSSLMVGKWDMEAVNTALGDIESGAARFSDIESQLLDLGMLTHTKSFVVKGKAQAAQAEFSEQFKLDLVLFTKELIANMPANMLPRREKVAPWTTSFNEDLNLPLVKVSPKYLKRYTYDAMPRVFDSINKSQAVAFRINPSIIPHLKAELADFYIDHANMTREEVKIAVQNHTRTQAQLTLVESLVDADELYFTITLDYRGREYYRGGIVTPQGDDFCKAAFRFANAPELGEHGMAGLAIHYANVYGNDKLSLNDRVAWAYGEGTKLAEQIATGHFPKDADKPYQTVVAGAEWHRIHRIMEIGVECTHITSGIVCHTDGTCNGSQHGAAVSGDRKTAEAVNCTVSSWDDIPSDVYGLANDSLKPLVEHFPALYHVVSKLGRSFMKKPVMVTGYGAGIAAVFNDIIACLEAETKAITAKEAKAAIADMNDNVAYVKDCISLALSEHIGAVMGLTKSLQQAIDGTKTVAWKCEDGFIAIQSLRAKEGTERTYIGNSAFRLRTDTGISESAMTKAIGPNFVHSMDGTHLRVTVDISDFDMVTVHDSYGSAPANFLQMNTNIRIAFVKIHTFDWLAEFNKCNSTTIEQNKGDYNADEVLQSSYFFS